MKVIMIYRHNISQTTQNADGVNARVFLFFFPSLSASTPLNLRRLISYGLKVADISTNHTILSNLWKMKSLPHVV